MNMFTSSYNSPSPTPTLRIESPFASFHSSSTPPHTPTCLPLSIVAPSPAPFYLDTSAPQQQPSTEVAFTSPILAPASPKSVSLLRTVKKTAILKKAASPSGLRPLTFQDFKASPSPIAHSLLDESTVEPVSPVSEVASEPSNPDKSPAPPSITTTSSSRSSKKSSSASQGTKKRHILQEWETEVLNKCFEQNQFLVSEQAKDLSARLGMTVNQVRIWFQNKRAFVKRQMSKNSNMTEDDD
ncbi:hypothetical protein HDU99_002817 [Rhizoclosmatium hyalinum]|nr:hypothetical protein HDU99_002817 [Rhizoclosmatium hyalinum]